MRNIHRFAAVSALAIALAACGSAEEEAEDTAAETEAVSEGAATDDAADEEAATAEPEAEETPEPTPTPTPTPTPEPTVAAPMAPPTAFVQCGVCHSIEPGQQGIGPSLAGVVGRRSAAIAGFSYSPAMRGANLTWNEGTLDRYLGDPAGVVPGTTMALPGLPADDRAEVIAYLKTL